MAVTESKATDRTAQERLVEHCDWQGIDVRVDRAGSVIRGVKILGLRSRNGRTYQPAALEQSAALYEGAQVNVDHPRGGLHAPRGYEERMGAIRNVRCTRDGLYGDFHFNPKHRLAEQLIWDAEHAPENVGFSHNVLARTSRQGRSTVVEAITRVQSVDLVADPATTRGLFESAGSAEARRTSGDASTGEIQDLRAENERLREEVDELRAAQAAAQQRERVDRAVAAANLPARLDTPLFREQCYLAADEQHLARILEARIEDARLFGQSSSPRCIEQPHAGYRSPPAIDAAGFAAALR